MIGRFVEVGGVVFEEAERPRPVLILASRFQHRPSGPSERRRAARGFLGKCARGDEIVAAPCFDEKPVQAERLGVGAARHGAEHAFGAVAVAGKLGGLRA